MAESAVQRKGLEYAQRRGAYGVNQWGTAISGSGVPDQLLCYRGFFVALEWKHPEMKLRQSLSHANDKFGSMDQQIHLKQIRDAGGVAWVVNSVLHVKQALDVIDDGLH